jgi:hypothetical protein
MIETQPTFYLVPVTQELNAAVIAGQYSASRTMALKCTTYFGPDRQSKGRDEEAGEQATCIRALPLIQDPCQTALAEIPCLSYPQRARMYTGTLFGFARNLTRVP